MENIMSKAQLLEMIAFYEISLVPEASEMINELEYRLLAVEEMENAGIA